ncbi:MAG: site-specific DNA-methyltransferase [Planctomycetota bacterium]
MPTLHFKGKSVIETHHHTVPHHTLAFDKKLSVLDEGQEPSLDGNLIIEGDNLLALKALLPTHAGKVKCVYIDPPYNTGNEGWVYNDNLTQPQFKEWIGQTVGKEGEDYSRHDKWCCMMYPRLMLLKELMREDGCIWVSIGDDEQRHLRHLLDEVFGPQNFIGTVVWQNATGPKQSNTLSYSHEYVLCFAKDATKWSRNLLPRNEVQEADYTNRDDDPRGPWRDSGLDARNYYSQGKYSITCPGGRVIEGPPEGRYWSISEDTLWDLDDDNRIWWGDDQNNVPRLKRFLSEAKAGVIPQTVWTYDEVGHSQEAKKDYLRVLSGEEVFTTPKPVRLIDRIIAVSSDSDGLILDAFAGSGTTGQAVLEKNLADGGNRTFILVQMPHDTKKHKDESINIAQRLAFKRIKNVMTGYQYKRRAGKGKWKKETAEGIGGSFTYAKLSDEPLFGDYRDLGDKLPAYDDIAAYIFYTETSHEWLGSDRRKNKAFDKKTGRIGEHRGTSYYLLYRPNDERDWGLDLDFAYDKLKDDPNRQLVVYCEKISLHRDQLRKFADDTGRRVRPMLVPFNLK